MLSFSVLLEFTDIERRGNLELKSSADEGEAYKGTPSEETAIEQKIQLKRRIS